MRQTSTDISNRSPKEEKQQLQQFHDLDVLEPHLITMILQQEQTLFGIAEIGPILVLAEIHQRAPHLVVAPVFDDLHTIQPVLHMVPLDNHHGGIGRESHFPRLVSFVSMCYPLVFS